MRTFRCQLQVSLDGYMGGPKGELDWLAGPWCEDLNAYVTALNEPIDTIVLGRRLAEGFIPHWASEPEDEDQAGIDLINGASKVVMSRTLTESPWEGTVVTDRDLTETITELKNSEGGDIITYGGATLVADLITRGLLDEIHLFVNPTALGAGLPVFAGLGGNRGFQTVSSRTFDCGITALHLAPVSA